MAAGQPVVPGTALVRVSSRQRAVVLAGRADPWLSALGQTLSGAPGSAGAGWDCRVIDEDSPDPDWRELAAALDTLTAPNLLLVVAMPPGTETTRLRALHTQLAAWYPDVQAAAWVRAPREAMQAALQEILVNGRQPLPREVGEIYPRYRELFAVLDDVFGRDRVLLAKLEVHALPAGDILQGLSLWLGLGVPADRRVRPAPAWLSTESLACLYAYRSRYAGAGTPARPGTNRRLALLLARLRGSRLRLSPDLVRPEFVRQRDDITWMELRLGIPLSEDMSMAAGDLTALPSLGNAVSPASCEHLQRLAGVGNVVEQRRADPAGRAADLLERLRGQLEESPHGAGDQAAALAGLFQRALPRAAGELEGLPPAQAVAFLQVAFAELRREVCAMVDTPVGLSSFGQFKAVSPAGTARRDVQFFPLTLKAP